MSTMDEIIDPASRNMSADKSLAPPGCGILQRLPLEVREQIYGYIFPRRRSVLAWHQDVFHKSKHIDTSLLTTSKQIGAEAEKVMFSQVRVLFEIYTGIPHLNPAYFNALPWTRLQNLWINIWCYRSLRCAIDSHDCKECRGDPHIRVLRAAIEKLGEQSDIRNSCTLYLDLYDLYQVPGQSRLITIFEEVKKLTMFREVCIVVQARHPRQMLDQYFLLNDNEPISGKLKELELALGPYEITFRDHRFCWFKFNPVDARRQ